MNEVEIKKYFLNDFKKQIQKVINNEEQQVKSKIIFSPDEIIKYLTSIGFEDKDKESNSWSWDFWCKLKFNNEIYYLSCSGYYNTGLYFYKEEE